MLSVARKLFGSSNDRKIKPMRKRVEKINALEPQMEALSDEALRAKTTEFRERLEQGAKLDDLLEEALREVGVRHGPEIRVCSLGRAWSGQTTATIEPNLEL